MLKLITLVALALLAACAGSPGSIAIPSAAEDHGFLPVPTPDTTTADLPAGELPCGDACVETPGPGADAADVPEAPETAAEDAGNPCDQLVRPFGCPCDSDADCKQPGYCIPVEGGKTCTVPCVTDCPAGYACSAVTFQSTDTTYMCLPIFARLCQPCDGDVDCLAVGGGSVAKCLDYGDAGSFCGAACAESSDCPDGYDCDATQCRRSDGLCACNALGAVLGMATMCHQTNDSGSCAGQRDCASGSLSACDAAVPAAETCNSADDDCDATVDELDPGQTCVAENEFGACPGAPACAGGKTVCVVDHQASPEQCNGLDDDCSGVADDGFTDTDEDGSADCVDLDDDGDGVADLTDKCPLVADPDQKDVDGDGKGDLCDEDADGDGEPNATDCGPLDPTIGPGAKEVCNGLDDDCDTSIDDGLCDDGNPCTKDACNGATCDHEAASLEGAPCEADGNGCTVDDACALGVCQPGVAATCPALGACVYGVCSSTDATGFSCDSAFALPGVACDDGQVCSTADTCDGAGACLPGAAVAGCCAADADCDDEDPCTADTCDAPTGVCGHAPAADGTACDADASGCTADDQCTGGQCAAGSAVVCAATGNACTVAVCVSDGAAAHHCDTAAAPAGTACDDEDVCTAGDACQGAACVPGEAKAGCCHASIECDDGNPCTLDACKLNACVHIDASDGTACDADGSGCTQDDQCTFGICVPGKQVKCPASVVPCFTTACASLNASEYACKSTPSANGAFCDDAVSCTIGDACDGAGKCKGAFAPSCCQTDLDCDDNDPCTVNKCAPATGKCTATEAVDGTTCDADGSGCTASDQCTSGICVSGAPASCPSGTCLVGSCVSTGSATYACGSAAAPAGSACSDGDACTEDDACTAGGACAGVPLAGKACCTSNADCEDGDVCTTDTCDVALHKCSQSPAPASTPCDADGSGCTVGDHCENSGCVAGPAYGCAEAADACNDPKCVSQSAGTYTCQKVPKGAGIACDDTLFCTENEKCDAKGICTGGAPRDCGGTGGACQPGYCDESLNECKTTVAFDGTSCDDGDGCTSGDACQSGACVGGKSACGEEPLSVTVVPVTVPALAALPGGRYAAVWSDGNQYAKGKTAYRTSDAVGSRENEEQLLADETSGRQWTTEIAVQPTGESLALAYKGKTTGGCSPPVGQACSAFSGSFTGFKFSVDGELLASKALQSYGVNCYPNDGSNCKKYFAFGRGVPLAFGDGTWALVSSMRDQSNYGTNYHGEIRFVPVAADLTPGASTQIVSKDAQTWWDRFDAAVIPDGNKEFVVSWMKVGGVAVAIQRYTKAGVAKYPAAIDAVNTGTDQIDAARLVGLPDGRYLVCWEQNTAKKLFCQRFYSDGVKLGSAFQLNIGAPSDPHLGDVAAFSDKSLVAVYEDNVLDGSGTGIAAQLLQEDGTPIGGPFVVNTITAGTQKLPALAVLSNDDFVVAFADASSVVQTRRFTKAGTAVTGRSEIRGNTTTAGAQARPRGAVASTGNVLVAYDSPKGGQTSGEVLARVFTAAGVEVAAEQTVNTTTAGAQGDADVAGGVDRFAVAWTSDGQDGDGQGVVARWLDGAGLPVSAEVVVNTTTAGQQRHAALAMAGSGKTFVAWTGPTGAVTDVYGRLFDEDGAALSLEAGVDASAVSAQLPSVAAVPTKDEFVVAYELVNPSGGEVRFRRVDGAGAATGGDVVAAASPFLYTDQRNPAIAVTPSGKVLVCFDAFGADDTLGWDIVCRYFLVTDFTAAGGDFRPNALTKGAQRRPALAALANGDAFIAFDSEYVDTTGTGITLARYGANGAAKGPRIVANRTWIQNQVNAFVVPATSSTVLVGWEAEGQDGDLSGIVIRSLPAP